MLLSQSVGGFFEGLAFVPSPAGGPFPAIVSADRFQESLDASIVANSGAVAGAALVAGGLAAGAALSGPALLTLGAGLPPVVQSAGPKLADLATRFGTTSPALLQNVLQNGARFADTANKSVNVLLRRPDSTGFIRVTLDPAQQRVISSGLVRARNVANSIANGRFVPLE